MHPYFSILGLRVPAYGGMVVSGLIAACAVGYIRLRRDGLGWEEPLAMTAAAWATALIGALLLYELVTFTPRQILSAITSGKIFDFSACGMVFYGGLIGAVPGAFFGAKLVKARVSDYIPALVPCVPLGHAVGRIGCFLGGCCYGQPTDKWYGIAFTHPASDAPTGIPLIPVQLFESALLVALFIVLCTLSKKYRRAGITLGAYLSLYGLMRFCLEFLRYDAVRGHLGVLSTSQWISLSLTALGLFLIISSKRILSGSNGKRYCRDSID